MEQQKFEVSHFVTFEADDLFCEPKLNDLALNQMEKNEVDFIFSENHFFKSIAHPLGLDC